MPNKPTLFLRCSLIGLLPLALIGCVAPMGPTVSMSQHQAVYQPFTHSVAINPALPLLAQLEGQLDGVAGAHALVEFGDGVDTANQAALRIALRQAGVPDVAQRWQPVASKQTFRLTLNRQHAHAAGCYQPIEPTVGRLTEGKWYGVRAVSGQLGCSVNANLAAQLVQPAELNTPAQLGAPNAVRAVGAVEAYQRGNVRELNEQKLEAGGGSGGGK